MTLDAMMGSSNGLQTEAMEKLNERVWRLYKGK